MSDAIFKIISHLPVMLQIEFITAVAAALVLLASAVIGYYKSYKEAYDEEVSSR